MAGVSVGCTIALPGLAAAGAGERAIRVVRVPFTEPGREWTLWSTEGGPPGPALQRSWTSAGPGGWWHRLRIEYREHAADFVLSPDGGEVRAAWTPAVPETHVAALLEGPVLGRALRLRGEPRLHGGTVALEGRAFALLGPSRAGKSTLAAALVRAGCDLVADEMVAWRASGSGFRALRGRRTLRLWSDAAAWLGRPEDAARVWPGIDELDKFVIPVPDPGEPAAASDSIPLAGIYVLGPRSPELRGPELIPLTPPEALATLAAQVYGALELPRAARLRELGLLAPLAGALPVVRLRLPHGLAALSDAATGLLDCMRHGRA